MKGAYISVGFHVESLFKAILVASTVLSISLSAYSSSEFPSELVSYKQDSNVTARRQLQAYSGAQSYSYSGGSQSFTVPNNVYELSVFLRGASGGDSTDPDPVPNYGYGGKGATIEATITVTPGEVLYVYIGGQGTTSAGGYNGGGVACASGGSGGGATDIRRTPYGLGNRLVVAGGGGGSYAAVPSNGGAGGYPSGSPGVYSTYTVGAGGTDVAGGAAGYQCSTAGTAGAGGACCGTTPYGSGGGGGYFGGGGAYWAGSGGGSSYTSGSLVSTGVYTSTGHGYATLQWTFAPTYAPTYKPTVEPSEAPTRAPTLNPTCSPTVKPTASPTFMPTLTPTATPTVKPTTNPTVKPTTNPTVTPSAAPTLAPTLTPTAAPTLVPTLTPTAAPTLAPTLTPTAAPTLVPTAKPTPVPTALPTSQPSTSPSAQPSASPTRQPSAQPTRRPSRQPTSQPSRQPASRPTSQPSSQPTTSPSSQPTRDPTSQPSAQPSRQPTAQPSGQPTSSPSRQPTRQPSSQPTIQPTMQPSAQPSRQPTDQPSGQPTSLPSRQPTSQPSCQPTRQPTMQPTSQPTSSPTTQPTSQPSSQPTSSPSCQPSAQPSSQPSRQPTAQPSSQPSGSPTTQPSAQPSRQPTNQPSGQPSSAPSRQPTAQPSCQPSTQPTVQPTSQPSGVPSAQPTGQPSRQPSAQPSSQPSSSPSSQPTTQPSTQPTTQPTAQPSSQPSRRPTTQPSAQPSRQPTKQPTCQPSGAPSAQPSAKPSSQPSAQPTDQPTSQPSGQPTAQPSSQPTVSPTCQPSCQPTDQPSMQPSRQPSAQPSTQPSNQPTMQPSGQPSSSPTSQPTSSPSTQPSANPSSQPTGVPTSQPSNRPSSQPSGEPSAQPSTVPTGQPSAQPSSAPSTQPSAMPSAQPSSTPSAQPSACPSTQPSAVPSVQPSTQPTSVPSGQPSSVPSTQPSAVPSSQPSSMPSAQPTVQPTSQPSGVPSTQPTSQPTSEPSSQPSGKPTSQPSSIPSAQPSTVPTMQPSNAPSNQPSAQPTSEPSAQPSCQPSSLPSVQPSAVPTGQPTCQPTGDPTNQPSSSPSSLPTTQPSTVPSTQPSEQPSSRPSSQPSVMPSAQPSSQPSASPSTQPTTAPSRQPSSQPSGSPSSQPTVTPSSQPSASPTAQPSVSPSAQPSTPPTSHPSAEPTTQPSLRPTDKPTSFPSTQPSTCPSVQPLSHPTSVPSSQPTTSPSSTPTSYQSSRFIYSKAPTAVPTCSPTLSELSVWREKMQSSLSQVTASDTVAVVHRSTYYELDVFSNSPSSVYGGCAAWKSALSGDVKPSQYVYMPASLSISAVVDPSSGDHVETFAAATAQCTDPAVTNSILSALVGSPQMAGGVSVSRSFQCGTYSWVVKHCLTGSTATYVPAVCVDCADPCSAVAHCNTVPSSAENTAGALSVSPCVPQQCTGRSNSGAQYVAATALRILSVSYSAIEKAPEILSVASSVTKTSIRVTAQLSSSGSLYCAVYRSGALVNAPASVSSVLLQNQVGGTDSTNSTVVTITGLDAASSYRVYLMTVSPIGVKSSLDQVLSSVREVPTACCKAVTATLSTTSAVELQSTANILSVALSSKPSAALRVDVQLYSVSSTTGEASLNAQSLFPSSFAFSSISASNVLRASLPALPAGLYEYRLVLSGAASAEYEVVYANGQQRIEVISAIVEPPVPVLTQAVFAKDGSYMTVLFSANTNKGGTATAFTCSALFDFSCAATSKCQWMDSATVRVFVQGTSTADTCAKPGSTLRLLSSAQVKARCQAAGDNGNGNACPQYSEWRTVPGTTLQIAAPASPLSPSVVISAPSVLGSCDSLTLDVSGSTGSGGRGWTNTSVTVLTTQGNSLSALTAHLNTITVLTPPPSLPASLLNKGYQYNFQVKLCNFLGQCNTGNKQVLVLNDTLPSVSLPGSALRTVSRKDSLVLTSAAFVSTCDGKRSSAGLTYKWSVFSNNVQLLTTFSTSKDASRYLLPPFSLATGTMYQVALSVSAAGNAQSSTASVQVYVQPGNIVAAIKGGSVRTMRVGDTMTLDAGPSYDEDLSESTGLIYSWSCMQSAPSYESSCQSIFDSAELEASASAVKFSLVALSSAAGAEGQVTLEVTDAAKQRSSRSTVTVSVLAALAPVVSVTAPSVPASGVINAGQLLQLTGTLSVPASMGGNATWVVDDASISLKSFALFPLTVAIPPIAGSSASALSSRTLYMAFPGNSFPAGTTLTFSLIGTIPYQGKKAAGSVSVTVNAPPTPGSFYVTPDEGVELDRIFEFVALNWVDSDLPITYQFSYLGSTGLSMVIRSKLELSFGSSLLPAGSSEAAHAVTCVAQIFDSLSANSSASYVVKVTQNDQFNASQVQDFVKRSLADAADPDSIKQATALSSYLMNAVNCSLAPNCTTLHRKSCQSTAHTCGICESLDFVGEEGDSNEACVPVSSNGERHLSSTMRYSALASADSPAVGTKKACPADCSGHGQCVHVLRDSGAVITADMPPCLEGLTGCLAVCDCDAAYFGSDSCEVPTAEFEQRQSSRGQVISALQTLVSMENPDEQVITGWVNGLSQATQTSSELGDSAAMSVLSLVDKITTSAQSVNTASSKVSSKVVAGLLSAVSAVADGGAKAHRRRKLLQNRRRSLAGGAIDVTDEVSAVSPSVTRDVLISFGTLVAASMLPGQDATQFTQGEFRMSVHVLSNTGEGSAEVAMPLTPLEAFLGHKSSQVTLPATSASAYGTSVVATSQRAVQFSGLGVDMLSNPMVLHSSAQVCAAPPCFVDVVLQNSQAAGFDALNADQEPEVHTATCLLDDHSVHDFMCKNGEALQIKCTGDAGEVSQRCPVISYSGACNSLSGNADSVLTGDSSGCTVHSYTDDEVTCRCEYFAQQMVASGIDESSRRALQSQGYNFSTPTGYSVSYVSMLQASAESFVSTIKTADDLNASTVTKGWRALATLGALAAGIVAALFWSHYSDNKAKRVTPVGDETGAASMLAVNKAGKSAVKNAGGRKVRFNTRSKKALVNAELSIVEDSLPRVLSSRTFSDRFMEEVKQHHRWFGIIFYFSDSFPRVLRVISLATNAIVMLFIQSITYNLTNPDDGSCKLLYTEVDCLGPRSPFATGESKCGWVPDESTTSISDGSCVFIEPDKSIRIILFVAIFCAIVTTPIALAADWVVLNILAAPTEQPPAISAESLKTTAASLPAPVSADALMTSLVPNPAKPPLMKRKSSSGAIINFLGIFNEEKLKEDKALLATSRAELLMLSLKLKSYRDKLRADEVEEFNILWGLDADGKFLTKAVEETTLWGRAKSLFAKKEDVNVKETVLMDLKNVNAAVRRESTTLLESGAPKYEIGKKLLFLFQCDLLPGISGKILELKGSRDTSTIKHVSLRAKVMGYGFLFLLDAGMLFYILLFALTQTGPRQNAWFQSFALWLVVEILFVSTAIVFITHIVIPSLIMKDLSQIKRRLMDNIRDFNEKVQNDRDKGIVATSDNKSSSEEAVSFNAANYLFVSSRLARQFPDLKESKIIAQFTTPWPRQSYLHVQNVSKKYSKKFSAFTRSASILLIFFVGNFLSVPPSCQDIIVQMTSTTAIGYIVLIHVQLFEIFPALVILPALSLAVLAHFIIQSSKSDAQLKLARLFPASTKKHNKISIIDAGFADAETVSKKNDNTGALAVPAVEWNDEEEKSESSYDSHDDTAPLPAIATALGNGDQQHRTRRQSIQTGLDLLHAMKQVLEHSPIASDSSSCSSVDDSSHDASSHDSSKSDQENVRDEQQSDGESDSSEDVSELALAVGRTVPLHEQLHLSATSPQVSTSTRKSLTSRSDAAYDVSDSDDSDSDSDSSNDAEDEPTSSYPGISHTRSPSKIVVHDGYDDSESEEEDEQDDGSQQDSPSASDDESVKGDDAGDADIAWEVVNAQQVRDFESASSVGPDSPRPLHADAGDRLPVNLNTQLSEESNTSDSDTDSGSEIADQIAPTVAEAAAVPVESQSESASESASQQSDASSILLPDKVHAGPAVAEAEHVLVSADSSSSDEDSITLSSAGHVSLAIGEYSAIPVLHTPVDLSVHADAHEEHAAALHSVAYEYDGYESEEHYFSDMSDDEQEDTAVMQRDASLPALPVGAMADAGGTGGTGADDRALSAGAARKESVVPLAPGVKPARTSRAGAATNLRATRTSSTLATGATGGSRLSRLVPATASTATTGVRAAKSVPPKTVPMRPSVRNTTSK